jgi:hypothetical protein
LTYRLTLHFIADHVAKLDVEEQSFTGNAVHVLAPCGEP